MATVQKSSKINFYKLVQVKDPSTRMDPDVKKSDIVLELFDLFLFHSRFLDNFFILQFERGCFEPPGFPPISPFGARIFCFIPQPSVWGC